MKFNDLDIETPELHICSGQPGTGKTLLLFSLADRLHRETGKKVYVALKDDDRNIEDYPNIPTYVKSFRGFDYPVDSIVIVDDAHRVVHARRFQSDVNVWLDTIHGLLRHDNIDFLYDTQTLSTIDRNNILRSKYRWYKRPYKKELVFSRPEIRLEIKTAYEELEGKSKKYVFLDAEDYVGLISDIPKPRYWSEELSTMHRRKRKFWIFRF